MVAQHVLDANKSRGLAELSESYLTCREFMHSWDPLPARVDIAYDGRNVVISPARCTRCGTVRRDFLNVVTLVLEGRSYDYPPGYQLDQAGWVLRADVRRERFRRAPWAVSDKALSG